MNKSQYFRMGMWALFILGGIAVSYWLDLLIFGRLYVATPCHLFCFLAGLVLMQIVRQIARNTGRYLHDFGREEPLPRLETNRLVRTGYYSLMRHPMHQGLMLAPFAVALLAGSPSFLFIIAPIEWLIMYLLIITYEEDEARKKFGEAYETYARSTPRFCFRLDCWKKLIRGLDRDLPEK